MKVIKVSSLQEMTDVLVKELGIKPGDKLNIRTPQFKREYKLEINWKPETAAEFDAIKLFSPEILNQMGVRPFDIDEKTGLTLYLYPGEWFNNIPHGYKVHSISGRQYLFDKETCDDDIRYGCLPYGFLK